MPPRKRPMVPVGEPYRAVAERIVTVPIRYPHPLRWWLSFGGAMLLVLCGAVAVATIFIQGIGVFGMNAPVLWGTPIINYVWWVGIGHAGTLISALLLLTQSGWRNALNRFAEAMTLFAVTMAAIQPIIHLGRPAFFWWMLPVPTTFGVWPQFRSPLVWDIFAILTYLIVSFVFWYIGAIPDLATARDRAAKRGWQVFYGLISLGWRGSGRQWLRWRQAYHLTAILAVPLVVSVHSEVSMLFAASVLPGWHSTVLPPYFVAGAAFSGFAVVSMLAIWVRSAFGLYELITRRHLDMLGKVLLATGLMTGYGYGLEIFHAFYSGEAYEIQTMYDRWLGEYAWSYWLMLLFNMALIQILWWRRARCSPWVLFAVSLGVAIGMWLERYMLLVTGLYHDFLPAKWGFYATTFWEWLFFAGTVGVFLAGFLLFIRLIPMISSFEVREEMHETAKEMERQGG